MAMGWQNVTLKTLEHILKRFKCSAAVAQASCLCVSEIIHALFVTRQFETGCGKSPNSSPTVISKAARNRILGN
jgi:hypothetical protein